MSIGRTQKRVTLFVILPALLVYFALRFYAQFRQVDVFVSRVAPVPAELASGLHGEAHQIAPTVMIESRYDSAAEKILAPDEIRRLRTFIAWSSSMPAFIDSLTILSSSNVVARQSGKHYLREYQLSKEDGKWVIVSMKRSQFQGNSPD